MVSLRACSCLPDTIGVMSWQILFEKIRSTATTCCQSLVWFSTSKPWKLKCSLRSDGLNLACNSKGAIRFGCQKNLGVQ